MDGVGYERGVAAERLIDPACGSGTFLVEAVERYLADVERYEDDPDWQEYLRDLCTRPRVVGLDVHPFAVLMAQIRFVVAILPAYREAKRENPGFTLRRLPIYRTDTLRNERELSGVDLGTDDAESWQSPLSASWEEDETEIRIPVPLPVEVDGDEGEDGDGGGEGESVETEDGFLVRRVRMPLFRTIREETAVRNFGEYFAALQGVLDTVKDHMTQFGDVGDWDWTYAGGVEERIDEYTEREYDGLESVFAEYVEDMLENVRYLQEEYDDGRLFKMFEDTVLALVVKNYMKYDYVVGNPPYVNIQNIRDDQKDMIRRLYSSAVGQFDLYCPFFERGLDWLVEEDGKLGFITPNQFMVTDYGEGTREIILKDSLVQEIYDFRDSGVFEDATNYPAVVILEDEPDKNARNDNTIRCVRVRPSTDEDTGRELDEAVINSVREHRGEPGYSSELIDVFDYPQRQLGTDHWALMPPKEQKIFDKIEENSDKRMQEITNAIFPGPTTGSNKVYVVEVMDAHQVRSDNEGDTVTVTPSGGTEEYEIETDLLRPWLSGSDVQRWRCEWSGNHVILPYASLGKGNRDDQLISEETLTEKYPLTWEYFKAHESQLRSRQSGRWEDSENWWEFAYPRNLERFERPKTVFAHITDEPAFMLDEEGTWYFKTAYAALLSEDWQELTEEIACQLNSKTLEYYFKHISTVKAGGYYEYRAQYVNPIPCVTADTAGVFDSMRERAEEIVAAIDLDSKTDRFPEAYLGNFDGELEYITYEWQTRHYPVSAEIEADEDGEFAVGAGRSDSIRDPAMYAEDREDRKRRAEYVHAAVDGRNVKRGEETVVPIPRRDDGVEELLARLSEDCEEVARTNVDTLEAEIDRAVYDLFDLTDEEREVIEEYLRVF